MISRGLFVSGRQCSSYKSQIALKHLSQSQLCRTPFRKYFLCRRLALNSRNYVPSRPEGSPGWAFLGRFFGRQQQNFKQPRFESTESLDASIQGRGIKINQICNRLIFGSQLRRAHLKVISPGSEGMSRRPDFHTAFKFQTLTTSCPNWTLIDLRRVDSGPENGCRWNQAVVQGPRFYKRLAKKIDPIYRRGS